MGKQFLSCKTASLFYNFQLHFASAASSLGSTLAMVQKSEKEKLVSRTFRKILWSILSLNSWIKLHHQEGRASLKEDYKWDRARCSSQLRDFSLVQLGGMIVPFSDVRKTEGKKCWSWGQWKMEFIFQIRWSLSFL